jgi:competence protein ComEA
MKMIRILFTFLLLSLSVYVCAEPVDINTADVQTLSKNAKGIGLSKAKAIIAYREKNGKFQKVNDLVKVKGIGRKIIEKNKDVLVVNLEK